MIIRKIAAAFVIGAAFFAGVALAQTYTVGDRFLVSDTNPFVYDQVNDIWLYPWEWQVDRVGDACADTGRMLEELGG